MAMLFLSLLALQAAGADATLLNGRCDYPATAGRPEPGEIRALCDSVAIRDGSIDFDRGRSAPFRFTGETSGPRLRVTRVQLPSGAPVAATGTCEIFHANARISVVTCFARAGWRTYVANFIPSRL